MRRYSLFNICSWAMLSVAGLFADSNYVFISDIDHNRVIVVDGLTYQTMAHVDVGIIPGNLIVSPDGTQLYVANLGSNSISVIDIATLEVTATIAVGSQPYFGITCSLDGSKLYVANSNDDTLCVIDTATNQLIATIMVEDYPTSAVLSLDGSKLYVSNAHHATISVIDTSNNQVITTLSAPPYSYTLARDPNADRIFVISIFGNSLVIDTTTDTFLSETLPTGSLTYNCIFKQDGTLCYITNTTENQLTIIDPSTLALLNTINLNTNHARGLALSSDETKLFIGSYDDGKLFVLDAATYEQLEVIDLGIAIEFITTLPAAAIQPPSSVAIRQDANRFFNQSDWVNTISWSAPTSGATPVSYRIYRDEELTDLIATITGGSPLIFRDHRRKKGETSSYYLVSVSETERRSQALTLQI